MRIRIEVPADKDDIEEVMYYYRKLMLMAIVSSNLSIVDAVLSTMLRNKIIVCVASPN